MRKFVEKVLDAGFQGVTVNSKFDSDAGKGIISVSGLRPSEAPITRAVLNRFSKNRRILGPQRKKLEEEILSLAAQARVKLGMVQVKANRETVKLPSHFDFYAASEPLNKHQINFHMEDFLSLLTSRGIAFKHEHSLKIAGKP